MTLSGNPDASAAEAEEPRASTHPTPVHGQRPPPSTRAPVPQRVRPAPPRPLAPPAWHGDTPCDAAQQREVAPGAPPHLFLPHAPALPDALVAAMTETGRVRPMMSRREARFARSEAPRRFAGQGARGLLRHDALRLPRPPLLHGADQPTAGAGLRKRTPRLRRVRQVQPVRSPRHERVSFSEAEREDR